MSKEEVVKVESLAGHIHGMEIESVQVRYASVMQEMACPGIEYEEDYNQEGDVCVLCVRQTSLDGLCGEYPAESSDLIKGLAHGFDCFSCKGNFTGESFDKAVDSWDFDTETCVFYLLREGVWLELDVDDEDQRSFINSKLVDLDVDDLDFLDSFDSNFPYSDELYWPADFPGSNRGEHVSKPDAYLQRLRGDYQDLGSLDVERDSDESPHMSLEVRVKGSDGFLVPLHSHAEAAEVANVLARAWDIEVPSDSFKHSGLDLPFWVYPNGKPDLKILEQAGCL